MQLFKHQEMAINLFKERNEKLYLNWETGTGKTLGSLAIANHYGFKNLLIVAPKIFSPFMANRKPTLL